jgi:hypothetical protein
LHPLVTNLFIYKIMGLPAIEVYFKIEDKHLDSTKT